MRAAAAVGVGYTALTKASGRSVLDLAAEATRAAADDAGLPCPRSTASPASACCTTRCHAQAVATTLALPQLRYVSTSSSAASRLSLRDPGGDGRRHGAGRERARLPGPQRPVSGIRVGSDAVPRLGGAVPLPDRLRRLPDVHRACGRSASCTRPVRGRRTSPPSPSPSGAYAVGNERADPARAARHRTATSRRPAWPSRSGPPTARVEVDGACAVLVTALERARDLRHPPAVIASGAYRAGARVRASTSATTCSGTTTPATTPSLLRDELFGRAGITPADVDFAEIYDCFTSAVLMGLEGLGFCERGEAGDFVRSGATALDGSLPGEHARRPARRGLPARHEHRRRGRAAGPGPVRATGRRRGTRSCVVTSGALVDGSALVLTADR